MKKLYKILNNKFVKDNSLQKIPKDFFKCKYYSLIELTLFDDINAKRLCKIFNFTLVKSSLNNKSYVDV